MTTFEKVRLFNYLSDPEVRQLFVSDQIREQIALQIRTMREKRGWTQTELGQAAEIPQPRISLLEDPDYSGLTIATLKKIAKAFDVGLIVRFGPFSELIDWITDLKPENLSPPSYEEERQMSFADVLGTKSGWPHAINPVIPSPATTLTIFYDTRAEALTRLETRAPNEVTSGEIDSAGDFLVRQSVSKSEVGKEEREFAIAA